MIEIYPKCVRSERDCCHGGRALPNSLDAIVLRLNYALKRRLQAYMYHLAFALLRCVIRGVNYFWRESKHAKKYRRSVDGTSNDYVCSPGLNDIEGNTPKHTYS